MTYGRVRWAINNRDPDGAAVSHSVELEGRLAISA